MKLTKEIIKNIKRCHKLDYRMHYRCTARTITGNNDNILSQLEFTNDNDNIMNIPIDTMNQYYDCFAWDIDYSFIHLLRVNDIINIGLLYDNDNDYLRNANLHCDQVRLYIYRGKKVIQLTMKTSITPDNTAKMIKR